ncbi:unnamed protein product [Prorocentrum cordatum]|uniref:Uncharacterized protein n=1 Tax=Prorocentrum cordatum TaxID=2364126 RepID=A0ABN9XHS6_9DINO|nr:unnamed protein product [Polarella glacialis]
MVAIMRPLLAASWVTSRLPCPRPAGQAARPRRCRAAAQAWAAAGPARARRPRSSAWGRGWTSRRRPPSRSPTAWTSGRRGSRSRGGNSCTAHKWDVRAYFEELEVRGYADDALQVTAPQEAMLGSNCMQERRQSRTKHIFVGDSQMMALRNALHRLNGCPEIWWHNNTRDHQEVLASIKAGMRVKTSSGRFHSRTDQSPDGALPAGCKEDGIASFIFWDAWLDREIPLQEIQKEIALLGVEPTKGDTVVVWVGSNSISGPGRTSVLLNTIDKLHALGVKMVWDSPTYIDEAIMAATTAKDLGTDSRTGIPITYTAIAQRKARGEIGSNQYSSVRRRSQQGLSRFR